MFWLGVGLIVFWLGALLLATWDLANAREAHRRRGHPATYEEVVEKLYANVPKQNGADLIRKALAEDKRVGHPGNEFIQIGGRIELTEDGTDQKLLDDLNPFCAS